jgi:hypothetical protein
MFGVLDAKFSGEKFSLLNIGKYMPYEEIFCGLMVRIPGYKSRGLGFDSWRYQIS